MSDSAKPPSGSDRRVVTGALFIVYSMLLTWLLLGQFEVPWIGGGALRRIELVPFVASGGAGASTVREAIANILFFVAFGLYLRLLAPRWGRSAVVEVRLWSFSR